MMIISLYVEIILTFVMIILFYVLKNQIEFPFEFNKKKFEKSRKKITKLKFPS